MADASDIARVRLNTNQPNNVAPYTDAYVGELIDSDGVAGASAIIWREKASTYADLVDVTEAGATHKYSDLRKSALEMAKYWDTQVVVIVEEEMIFEGPVIQTIERESA